MDESAEIIASYEDGVCPDCGETIPVNVVNGSQCDNCEHVFYLPRPTDDESTSDDVDSSVTVLNDTPGQGKVRVVAKGSKGSMTITIEVDEDGFPTVDCNFVDCRGIYFKVEANGDSDPSRVVELEASEQLCVTVVD